MHEKVTQQAHRPSETLAYQHKLFRYRALFCITCSCISLWRSKVRQGRMIIFWIGIKFHYVQLRTPRFGGVIMRMNMHGCIKRKGRLKVFSDGLAVQHGFSTRRV